MWKEYAVNSIKNSKAASISIVAATLVSSILLSLLCGIFYNIWADDMQNPEYTNATLSGLIYSLILLLAGIVLILIIRNAFAVVMNAKIHQLGLLQSAGASPGQIRSALLYEAFLLSTPPIIAGTAIGTGLSWLLMRFLIRLSHELVLPRRTTELVFQMHPLVIAAALALAFLTVYISAWIPAWKLSKISPLEAIRAGGEEKIKRMRQFRFLSRFFGVEGELAGKSLYARRKAFRISSVSLLLSLVIFSAFLNTDTISSLSTKRTYFDRLATEERAEALENDRRIREVYKLVMGGLCGLVAVIGIANVFSNALSGVFQRRREFARYASAGMTPAGIRKMLILEALMVSLKPIVINIILNAGLVAWGLNKASIPVSDYYQDMPLAPIAAFCLLIIGLVGLGYFIGGSRIVRQNTAETLQEDVLL